MVTMAELPENFIIDHEGGMYPYQAEGRFGDEVFYFRYRSDNAQLSVGLPESDEDKPHPWYFPMPVHPPRLYAEIPDVFDDPMRGWLSKEEAHDLMVRLVSMLKPPSEWEQGTYHDRLVSYLDALRVAMDKVKKSQGQDITDEINSDPEEVDKLTKSREQAREGKTTPLSEMPE